MNNRSARPPEVPNPPLCPHLVVGLGASAGGMQALGRLFEHMPARTGMAFVVVLHLSPDHESHAAEILQRSTRMPVRQVVEPVVIEPDQVYVIPPGKSLAVDRGLLQGRPEERVAGINVAIDTFFRVLANVQGSRAAAVVLSGTGTDGAVGLQRIKELGGVALAQAPDDALHDSMPRAAIATGMVDFVLPVADMPARLLQLARNGDSIRMPQDVAPLIGRQGDQSADNTEAAEAALAEIMVLLRSRTRHDFRHYKRPTVLRRLERRMQVTGVCTLADYRDHLQNHADETLPLLQDMLISVTSFFRDRLAFEALERDVLPALVAQVGNQRPLRAWVVGCASGEEAYSVAMLLQEAADHAKTGPQPMQVFATDIDDRALERARAGVYPSSIITDVPPTRLRSFFVPQQDHLRVTKTVRDRVLFAHHNVLRDPPFSRVDLICCRNLLIYLDARAQATVLNAFRFALNRGGVLFLGASETAESAPGLFSVLDKKNRIYRMRGQAGSLATSAVPGIVTDRLPLRPLAAGIGPGRDQPWSDLHRRARSHHAPPSAMTDLLGRIVHLSEGMAAYLQPVEGMPSQLLLDNVRPQLRLALRAALFQFSRPLGVVAGTPAVSVDADTDGGRVRLTVTPLGDPADNQEVLLVSFQAQSDGSALLPALATAADSAELVAQLEAEKAHLQQQLATVIEHGETSTEELMSSNEELQALNEELRSATEELETSREELQSTNEELTTVNAELAHKVDEADRVNDDLQNLINANDIATVFVDSALCIKRFTPRAVELFNLIASDVGRPLQHITHRLQHAALVDDALRAFNLLQPVDREVQTQDGRYFIARVLPYRTGEDKIEGVVLTFVDVTLLRQAQQSQRTGAEQLRLAAETTRDFAILTTDDAGVLTSWNVGAERLFGHTQAQALGQPLALIFTDEDRANGVPQQELQSAREHGRAEDERWHQRADGSIFYCSGVTTRLDEGRGFAKIARDLTGSVQSAQARERLLTHEQAGRREAEATVAAKEMFLAVMSHELKHPLNLIHLNAELLTRLPEIRGVAAAQRAAQLIQQTVQGQARIVDDLLDLSRARTGKLTLDPAPVDWVDTVRRITEALRPDAQAKGVRLVFEPGAMQTLLLLFDPVRADQVVWNLLSNALKFTPPGGSVRASLTGDDGHGRLTITDTGCGIAAADLAGVFDMFSQPGNSSRSEQNAGLGIGLALVRELVQAHGGRVQVRSEGVGRGAEFSVWVPLYSGPAVAMPPAPAPSVLQPLRLLLVDDSADSVESQAQLLALTGATVVAARSGAEALACLDRDRFDLLISDISMPGMSGLDLITKVRARADGAQMLALACSGYGRAQDAKRAVDAGFDALLPKPASLTQIERTVAALLARRANSS